jgi:GNAT superfamily N-acetyltransferase
MFHVKKMSTEDIEFAVHITNQIGWNLAKGDFEFMMELEPDGCFILSHESEKIGLATTISYSKVGWFGNLLVKEEYRQKGAGSQLVQHSIEYLKTKNVETVGLYAYLERVPFYKRLGFKHDLDFVVLKGKGFSSPIKANMREARSQDVQEVIEYDSSCFGSSRRKLLEPIILDSDNICYVSLEDKRICGYAVAKVYRGMAELGPLVCQQGRDDVAIDLLKAMLSRLKGMEVSMFVPAMEGSILNMLKVFGFEESFRIARMFYGSSVTGHCVLFAESLERG